MNSWGRHDTQQIDAQHNDNKRRNKKNATLSMMAEHYYTEYNLYWVSHISPWCWVTLCWMASCWASLCWVSWRLHYGCKKFYSTGPWASFRLKKCFLIKTRFIKWRQVQAGLRVEQGDQMFLWKNRQKTMKNCPKSLPTMFLLDLLYKLFYGVFCLILC